MLDWEQPPHRKIANNLRNKIVCWAFTNSWDNFKNEYFAEINNIDDTVITNKVYCYATATLPPYVTSCNNDGDMNIQM